MTRFMTRFKKGTKVVCIRGYTGAFTIGSIYECRDNYGGIVKNDKGSNTDGFSHDRRLFEKHFIPVSEIEPFAVRYDTPDEFDDLIKYGKSLGYWKDIYSVNIYPHYVYFNTTANEPYYSTGTFSDTKKLTFEQFENNEHIMNVKEYIEEQREKGNYKLEVSPEFVKEAHKAACATWKKKIEDQFPILFESAELIAFKKTLGDVLYKDAPYNIYTQIPGQYVIDKVEHIVKLLNLK